MRAVAIVDAADHEWASRHRWSLTTEGYARRIVYLGGRHSNGQRRKVELWLHREVLGLAPHDPREGDHENGDRLDCRRSNLRIATRALNGQNVPSRGGHSRYRGVSWHRRRGRWTAQVRLAGKLHHLGYFDCEREASAAAATFRRERMPFATERV